MKRKYFVFMLLSIFILFLCSPAMAAGDKFVRAYRDSNYDMYVNRVNIIQNQGVVSFWVKSVYSDQGKALVRKELPKKHRKAPIQYGLDYFVFDTKKGKYNIKLASVYANEKEIYREGSKKWLPIKDGTIAAVLINEVNKALAEKNN
ncbi:MAG: hypothetical protein PHD08_03680 [Synergistaceae bacterium]|jgi:hypothetical protein|nr:hypothetical protein [Synergistaceae bacterium]